MRLNDIDRFIADFIAASPLNRVEQLGGQTIFSRPLVGVASAGDELFERLKAETAVGPQHMSPREWMTAAKAVIVYFLPFTERIRQANRVQGVAAREWLHGRIEGEQFNNKLRDELVQFLVAAGFQAVAPARDGSYKVVNRRSNWTERHAACIAGLGTFSLSRSLITACGSAGRVGSVITSLPLEATVRLYQEIDQYCSKCGACILRCPPLAITEQGKDNDICAGYLDRVQARFKPYYGCGKCQTGVPCESGIPRS